MQRRTLLKLAAAAVASPWIGSAIAAATSRYTRGAWASELGEPLISWPLIPVHAVLLNTGQLLTYGTGTSSNPTTPTGMFLYDLWDHERGHLTLQNKTGTDVFCGSQIILPWSGGKVLLAGGDNFEDGHITNIGNNDSNIFDPSNNSLTPSDWNRNSNKNMFLPRWYATPTTLYDGRIYLQGGDGGESYPEIRALDGTYRLLTSASTSSLSWYYPRQHAAPDGRIFGYAQLAMYYFDPRTERITGAGWLPSSGPSNVTDTDAMYAPGKILRCGGGPDWAATNAAMIIDINGPSPTYQNTAPMPLPLHWANATVLANGTVAVTGGSKVKNTLTGVNRHALIWRPQTQTWTPGAWTSSGKARLYHSIAILLPDASLLVGGGGAGDQAPQENTNAEIYYPAYLFNADGSFAPRPIITSSPAQLPYGQDFEVRVANASPVSRVTLIKTGSVTHSFNFEQRFMQLSFTTKSPGVLNVRGPANWMVATPGTYLMFVFNSSGKPSVAKIVQL